MNNRNIDDEPKIVVDERGARLPEGLCLIEQIDQRYSAQEAWRHLRMNLDTGDKFNRFDRAIKTALEIGRARGLEGVALIDAAQRAGNYALWGGSEEIMPSWLHGRISRDLDAPRVSRTPQRF